MLYFIEPNDLDMNNKKINIPPEHKDKLTIVIVIAEWCGHCKKALPNFISDAKNSENNKNFAFYILDSTKDFKNDNDKISKFFDGFIGYPHIVTMKNGKQIAKYNGNRSEKSFINHLNSLL
jgi:thiol-disulfide isomerase/thioredoxin